MKTRTNGRITFTFCYTGIFGKYFFWSYSIIAACAGHCVGTIYFTRLLIIPFRVIITKAKKKKKKSLFDSSVHNILLQFNFVKVRKVSSGPFKTISIHRGSKTQHCYLIPSPLHSYSTIGSWHFYLHKICWMHPPPPHPPISPHLEPSLYHLLTS